MTLKTATVTILLTIACVIFARVSADLIIKELFVKDINNWLLLLGLIATSLCIPRSLNGILSLAMVVATLYILFIR